MQVADVGRWNVRLFEEVTCGRWHNRCFRCNRDETAPPCASVCVCARDVRQSRDVMGQTLHERLVTRRVELDQGLNSFVSVITRRKVL